MASEKLWQSMNRGDLNALCTALQAMGFGSAMQSQLPMPLYRAVPAVSAVTLSSTAYDAIQLPPEAKAAAILYAYAHTTGASGTLGALTIKAFVAATAPADGEICIGPNGDLLLLASSAYTAVDVVYVPLRGDVVQLTLTPASNNSTIPSSYKALMLLSVDASTGTAGGAKTVASASGSSAAAGTARLDVAMTHIKSNSSDALTSITATLLVKPAIDCNAALQGAGQI